MPLITTFYLERSSVVHRLHPRVKMIGVLVVFVAVMAFNDPIYQAGIMAAIFIAAGLARLSPLVLLERAKPVIFIGALVAVVWALFGPDGDLIWQWWIFHVTTTSVLYGIAVGLRIISLALAFFFVLQTTQQSDVLYGLISLKLPYQFAFIIATIFRFAPTISGEAETIREAQRARAMDFDKGSVFTRIRKSMSFVVPLLVRVLKTTVELSLAIGSKAYGAFPKRTYYRARGMSGAEWAVLIALILIAIGCVVVRFLGFGAVVPETL